MKSLGLVLILISIILAGCGGQEAVGDAEAGRQLFNQSTIDGAPGCVTCHSLQPGEVLVGPSLAGVASLAEERVPDRSAAEYLRESIVSPDSFVVEGFSPGVMYQNYEEDLSEEQIDNLVAFLLTLE